MSHRIEVVRGSLEGPAAKEVLDFWATHGALEDDVAGRRVPEVVSIVRDGDGAVVGVNSVYEDSLAQVGGHRFWMYRRFVAAGAPADTEQLLLSRAFAVLNEEATRSGSGPVGLCWLVPRRLLSALPRDAVWSQTAMRYGGYARGRQIRLRYFDRVVLPGPPGGDRPLAPGYRIELLAESEDVTTDDVLDLWRREAALPDAEATRRITEVMLVAVHESKRLAGVYSVYLHRNRLLRMDLWYTRGFVAAEHRLSNIAVQLGYRGYDMMEDRFVSGADRRAHGTIVEVHSKAMQERFPQLVYDEYDAHFAETTPSGYSAYPRFFPGAEAPLPQS